MREALLIHDKLYRKLNPNTKEITVLNGTVHSKFNKAINLQLDNGLFFSVLNRNIDASPFSILLDLINFDSIDIFVGEKFYIKNKTIYFKNEVVSYKKAKIYKLNKSIIDGNSEYLIHNYKIIENKLQSLKDKITNETEKIINNKLYLVSEELFLSFKNNDEKKIMDIIEKLIGLGMGLTPSGDDYISGLLLIIVAINSPLKEYKELFYKIILKNKYNTNIISYEMLKNSIEGDFKSLYTNFLNKVFNCKLNFDDIDMILKIGHTSGKDTLLGIFTGLKILLII
ncbi:MULTISPECIES: DUF2877 domain-containing protein [Helcococcus]|uniref:DUF2877 domain-containing protein n=1 Tax=Helcococcus bovis TaxID=3153252 RepID=A0ABW9F4N3_9FIRM